MANRNDKVPENVEGHYYVDAQCIDCSLCKDVAPHNFHHQEEGGYMYIAKQPEDEEQKVQCKEAMEACPVEAIGDDGDSQNGQEV